MQTENFIQSYTHQNRIGVIVEFSLQSSYPTLKKEFIELTKGIAMHIAATNPKDIDELMNQNYSLDLSTTIACELERISSLLKEKIGLKRFIRWDTEITYPPVSSPEPPDKSPAVAMHIVKSG